MGNMRHWVPVFILGALVGGAFTYVFFVPTDDRLLPTTNSYGVANRQHSGEQMNTQPTGDIPSFIPRPEGFGTKMAHVPDQAEAKLTKTDDLSAPAPSPKQQRTLMELEARLYEQGMRLDVLLETPEARSLPSELRDKLSSEIVRRLNQGELRPEEFLPNFNR